MLLLLYCLPLLFKVLQRCVSCCCGWLWCLPLLLKVLQRSGSSCCCYIYCLPLLFKVLQMCGSCCCCYIAYHCCLRFDRGEVHVVVIMHITTA